MAFMSEINPRAIYASYGVLITVLGLLSVVIFSDAGYDFWDIIIGLIGAIFAICFVINVPDANWIEVTLAGLITGMGAAIIVAMIYAYGDSTWYHKCSDDTPKLGDRLFGFELVIASIVLVIFLISFRAFYWIRNRKGHSRQK